MTRRVIVGLALLALGSAYAEGSLSVRVMPLEARVDATLEQSVGTVEGWTIYAGSGVAWSPAGLQELQPYSMACRSADFGLAYGEVCLEGRAPLVGDGDVLRVFTTLVW